MIVYMIVCFCVLFVVAVAVAVVVVGHCLALWRGSGAALADGVGSRTLQSEKTRRRRELGIR
jgi:multidrug transporter EmrE-like cation transporter